MQAGDGLYRYDGDTRTWALVQGLEAAGTLLGVDAAGSAWVRVGDPHPVDLLERRAAGARALPGRAGVRRPAGAAGVAAHGAASRLAHLGSRRRHHPRPRARPGASRAAGRPRARPSTAWAARRLSGVLKPVSLAALADGWHTLTLAATTGEATATRRVHFEFLGSASAAVSWEQDIRQLGVDRCGKCHATGTAPELITYAQWKANAAAIAAAVRESRMPADGPLDSAGVAAIIRWVNGGAQP